MHRYVLFPVTAFVLMALPARGQAQVQAGPFAAFHDDKDLGIGAFMAVPFDAVDENLSFVADLGIFFPDEAGGRSDHDYFEINANFLYGFPLPDQEFTPWALGGVNIARCSFSVDSEVPGDGRHTDTELGLNLGGGITFGTGATRPFVGVKFELGGGDGGVLFGGVSFVVGEGR